MPCDTSSTRQNVEPDATAKRTARRSIAAPTFPFAQRTSQARSFHQIPPRRAEKPPCASSRTKPSRNCLAIPKIPAHHPLILAANKIWPCLAPAPIGEITIGIDAMPFASPRGEYIRSADFGRGSSGKARLDGCWTTPEGTDIEAGDGGPVEAWHEGVAESAAGLGQAERTRIVPSGRAWVRSHFSSHAWCTGRPNTLPVKSLGSEHSLYSAGERPRCRGRGRPPSRLSDRPVSSRQRRQTSPRLRPGPGPGTVRDCSPTPLW